MSATDRRALRLAWAAYRAGTLPIGAVVVDAAERVVAEGRNRVFERDPPAGRLAWTRLAHAEVDALAALPPDRRYDDHTVVTSLEPCPMCLAATRTSTVGAVRYLGADPCGGTLSTRTFRSCEEDTGGGGSADDEGVVVTVGRREVQVRGPRRDAVGTLAAVLPIAFLLRARPDGPDLPVYRREWPGAVGVAGRLLDAGLERMVGSGATVEDALALLPAASPESAAGGVPRRHPQAGP